MKNILGILSAVLISTSAMAGVLETVNSGETMSGVNLAAKATATTAEGVFGLVPVGHGIRVKKIIVVNAKIYVAQLFVDNPAAYIRIAKDAKVGDDLSSLKSLEKMKAVALKLDFIRDVDAAT